MAVIEKKNIKTHSLGYPRIGEKRELKRATEAYWKGKISQKELLAKGKAIRVSNWLKQQKRGIDLVPVNDFSFYDQILDMSCLLGNIPPRFKWNGENTDVDTVFTVARGTGGGSSLAEAGKDCQTGKISTFASEMTKWFDTNYHYIVPEFQKDTTFKLSSHKIFEEFEEAKELGINGKPVIVGPVTYLTLGKVQDSVYPDFDPFTLLDGLLDVYEELIIRLADLGAEWIQIDEPIFSTDMSSTQLNALEKSYKRLSCSRGSSKLLVATYFGAVKDNLDYYLTLPVDGLHFDMTRGEEDLDDLLANFPEGKILSLGIVDGRNVWKNRFDHSLSILRKARDIVGSDNIWLAPGCSLLHTPITVANELLLDAELKSWMSFADEKIEEVHTLRELLSGTGDVESLVENRAVHAVRKSSKRITDERVQSRLEKVEESAFCRWSDFKVRQLKQREKLKLPNFPTSTIGSFPQTREIRKARSQWRKGLLSDQEYDRFLKNKTFDCIKMQEEIGIDMLVHGEFERNDMVEFFGENLEGFAFTQTGWVQSYGTRYVKPPVIFGDVSRPRPMTVYWSKYAQSLTERPMKGMLTGPVTILQWSFVRDDQPRSTTANQIALAIRDEVLDLESAGIAAIQIDEPAFREGLPLRTADWEDYLNWAVRAFRLSSCGVQDDTQIHTHMCYSEFNDIIDSIAALDADVITIETSRSNMELLEAFVAFDYPNEIGPGVYDIHSPRVPAEGEMVNLMRKAEAVLPAGNLWVNPDCGLKTRQWSEVRPSLVNMVGAAAQLRAAYQNQHNALVNG